MKIAEVGRRKKMHIPEAIPSATALKFNAEILCTARTWTKSCVCVNFASDRYKPGSGSVILRRDNEGKLEEKEEGLADAERMGLGGVHTELTFAFICSFQVTGIVYLIRCNFVISSSTGLQSGFVSVDVNWGASIRMEVGRKARGRGLFTGRKVK